jgi:hypothetical protein
MNKAFVREPDAGAEYCPRCGSKGEPVGADTLATQLPPEHRAQIAASANFCPAAQCEVVYFDSFERVVTAGQLPRPVYPKDQAAPICACFGLTREDIEQDVAEGAPTRTRALLEKAKSPQARCRELAANGQSCVAYVQKCYMQCLNRRKAQP